MIQLGRLSPVAVRDAWPREDYDFTPWLSQTENLTLLGEALDLTLELVETECNVGTFRADLVAKRVGSEETVIIENQFGNTDHSHLGQLITYAAGLGGSGGAKTVVWIAERFTEPHRAALDWLNQRTDTMLGFFGVELELWRIGDSPLAPKFNVVSRPNNFQKELSQQAATLSETDRLYQRFWQAFIEYCGEDTILNMPSAPYQHWLPTYLGKVGYGVNLTASKRNRKLECQLWLEGKRADEAFAELSMHGPEIKSILGDQVTFDGMPGRRASKIFESRQGDVENENAWPEMHKWLKDRGEAYVTVFKPLVQNLV